MAELKEKVRRNREGAVVVGSDYVRHQLSEGMKGFFAPYMSVYEALTGTQTQLVKRDAKTGRFSRYHRATSGRGSHDRGDR